MPVKLDLSQSVPISAPVKLDLSQSVPIQQASTAPEQPGYFKRLGQSLGLPTSMEEVRAQQAEMQNPATIVKRSILGPVGEAVVGHVGQAYTGIKEGLQEAAEAGTNIGQGGPILPNLGKVAYGALHGTMQSIPFIGKPTETAGEDIANKNYAGAAGGLTGVIAQVVAPKIIEKLPGAAKGGADVLRESAAKNYENILDATKEKMKAAASEEVVPGLIERKVVAKSTAGLRNRVNLEVAKYGNQVGKALDAAEATGKGIPTQPIIDALESAKESYRLRTGTGEVAAESAPAIGAFDRQIETLKAFGDTVTPKQLKKIRKWFDDEVSASRRGFLLDQPTPALDALRDGANKFRAVLNDNFPELAKANDEFHFWKTTKDVLDASAQRKAAQTGIVGHAGRILSGGGLAEVAGRAVGIPGLGIAGATLAELRATTAYRSLAAATKLKIASLLHAGDTAGATVVAREAISKAVPRDQLPKPPAVVSTDAVESTLPRSDEPLGKLTPFEDFIDKSKVPGKSRSPQKVAVDKAMQEWAKAKRAKKRR